jgi:pyruvate dehydrogenase E2 component (dihydrolipoamide acetyltransferase)
MSSRRPRPDQQEYTLLEQTATRKAIGERTLRSVLEKPVFWMQTQVDASALVDARTQRRNRGDDPLPSYNDFIIKAVALALRNHPRFNAWVAADGLHLLKHINVGFAVATDQGVLMPTVLDADVKALSAIAAETSDMIRLARAGKLRASLQMGAGFSISNIGPSEVDSFSAIISPPQTGILAVGALKPRPLVVDGQIVARPTLICTLSVDHIAADGADGARFLGEIKSILEDPAQLQAF